MSRSVIIVGAGAAGLTCASDLGSEDFSVTILEARDRIGGRIFTQHIPGLQVPVELGAEFVHGRPPEILDLMKSAREEIVETSGDDWCREAGELSACNFFEKVEKLLAKMHDYASPDRSFSDFLNALPRAEDDENTRLRALEYVSGFNAADPAKISVKSLIKDMERSEQLCGDAVLRPRSGYSALVAWLEGECTRKGVKIHLSHVVERVKYGAGGGIVSGRQAIGTFEFKAEAMVVTVPASLLRPGNPGSVAFEPELPESRLKALNGTAVGPVVRVVMVFHEVFWKHLKGSEGRSLAKMRFLLSHDQFFPTWWTQHPVDAPMLVAWAAGPRAEQFRGWTKPRIVQQAISNLGQLFTIPASELRNLLRDAFLHDWQSDPWSRGAYSYLGVGAADAPEELARPIADILFFAGEATDTVGDHGTVHGAIASGHRAAREVMESLERAT